MKTMYKLFTLALVVLLAACGATSGDKELAKKKAELEKLKGEHKDLAKQIDSLEAQIKRIDPTTVKEEKTKLVAVAAIIPAQFTHYIDLKGKIDAQNIGLVTPRRPGGLVKAIFVKQGDPVRKGQLLDETG